MHFEVSMSLPVRTETGRYPNATRRNLRIGTFPFSLQNVCFKTNKTASYLHTPPDAHTPPSHAHRVRIAYHLLRVSAVLSTLPTAPRSEHSAATSSTPREQPR